MTGRPRRRILLAMTGATGAAIGVRVLEQLAAAPDIETHLIVSKWARQTIAQEIDTTAEAVLARADVVYNPGDMAAAVASGSYPVDAMLVVPCSMRTLAAIATGYGDNLIQRAADVTLKERRPLVLVPRETPLSAIHLRNMLTLAELGAVIMPPMPAFYSRPGSVGEIVDQTAARILGQIGLTDGVWRWSEDAPGP